MELTFYDANDVILASHIANFSVVDLFYNISADKIQFFYSIDLIGVPIALLNKTVKIDLGK